MASHAQSSILALICGIAIGRLSDVSFETQGALNTANGPILNVSLQKRAEIAVIQEPQLLRSAPNDSADISLDEGSQPINPIQSAGPKRATEFTRQHQAAVAEQLNLADRQDFEDANRGFLAPLLNGAEVRNSEGRLVWSLSERAVAQVGQTSPDTVNPSLWRQSQLLGIGGLFQVAARIYQVRGLDLANITFIEGDSGVIVMDPLLSTETAAAALELYYQHRPRVPVRAVIITHSHPDHFGGTAGIVSAEQLASGEIPIIAPKDFLEEVVSESVLAGNAMQRRAGYMYGSLLPKAATGDVGNGLGLGTASGTISLVRPTDCISRTGELRVVDGLTFEFQLTPGSEAPAEMHLYIRELKALCPAENATHTMHNLYTLRGAKVRDARAWTRYLQQTIDLFGNRVDVLFAPHHWPVWGQDRIVDHLAKQRDLYKYIHDQTLRLANRGYNMDECAEMIQLPPELDRYWSNRGYYGSLNHNVKAVWNFYLGWFDGHPARLHPFPPRESGRKYVEFMGGIDRVLEQARVSFDRGEYRWVVQVLDHAVSAEPQNQAARELLADALEQLGYQAECGPWRNFYLTGAQELRQGIQSGERPSMESSQSIAALPLDSIFDSLAVRLNSRNAAGENISVNFRFTDTGEEYNLQLKDRVLNAFPDRQSAQADCTVRITRTGFDEILEQRSSFVRQIFGGHARIAGSPRKLQQLFLPIEPFEPWFEIMLPRASVAELDDM